MTIKSLDIKIEHITRNGLERFSPNDSQIVFSIIINYFLINYSGNVEVMMRAITSVPLNVLVERIIDQAYSQGLLGNSTDISKFNRFFHKNGFNYIKVVLTKLLLSTKTFKTELELSLDIGSYTIGQLKEKISNYLNKIDYSNHNKLTTRSLEILNQYLITAMHFSPNFHSCSLKDVMTIFGIPDLDLKEVKDFEG